jgi:peroxiredoxin
MLRYCFVGLFACAACAVPQGQTEKGLLAGLNKLARPIEPASLTGKGEDEVQALVRKRAETALELVAKFEAEYPDSPSLAAARGAALKAVGHVDDEALIERAARLARRLKRGAPQGSDLAAEADLYLLGQRIHKVVKGAASVAQFREAWNADAEQIRDEAATFLNAYPRYRYGADAINGLVRLAQTAGDEKTPRFLREAIAKHFPDHPAARILARERVVGKEFDFAFTPTGSEGAMRLKELRGKVVVIAFWASWCVPCRTDLAFLKEQYAKYHEDGLEIVGISLDQKEEAARRYVKKHQIPGLQVAGPEARKFGEVWGVEHIPTQFVLDRQGRLHSVEAAGRLEKLIPELLAAK